MGVLGSDKGFGCFDDKVNVSVDLCIFKSNGNSQFLIENLMFFLIEFNFLRNFYFFFCNMVPPVLK